MRKVGGLAAAVAVGFTGDGLQGCVRVSWHRGPTAWGPWVAWGHCLNFPPKMESDI